MLRFQNSVRLTSIPKNFEVVWFTLKINFWLTSGFLKTDNEKHQVIQNVNFWFIFLVWSDFLQLFFKNQNEDHKQCTELFQFRMYQYIFVYRQRNKYHIQGHLGWMGTNHKGYIVLRSWKQRWGFRIVRIGFCKLQVFEGNIAHPCKNLKNGIG